MDKRALLFCLMFVLKCHTNAPGHLGQNLHIFILVKTLQKTSLESISTGGNLLFKAYVFGFILLYLFIQGGHSRTSVAAYRV